MPKKEKILAEYHLPSVAKSGIHLQRFVDENLNRSDKIHEPHRDTHVLFNFSVKGTGRFFLDFKTYTLISPVVMMVFPGQVHYIDDCQRVTGWSIAFDPLLMGPELQQALECVFKEPLPLTGNCDLYQELQHYFKLLAPIYAQAKGSDQTAALQGLLVSMLHWVAGTLKEHCAKNIDAKDRSKAIELHFKSLLQKHFIDHKKPAFYSEQMSISTAHLGDTIKTMTGKPVTQHIQEISLLEAKRHLFNSSLTIKEICFLVGYDDPVHFGKIFKKHTGMTPLEFRKQIRE